MSETFLEMITAKKRAEIKHRQNTMDVPDLKRRAVECRTRMDSHRLHGALSRNNQTNIIAEIKRASPSKGVINDTIDVSQLARDYETGGAAAISVLTESEYFQGSLEDLKIARASVKLPILRKDFIVDESQVYEAALAGADAVLLIVAAMTASDLTHLLRVTEDELGMDALVEVHTTEELSVAADHGASVIGVNNRNLHSLEVSLDVSRSLIAHKPDGSLMVAESGLSSRGDIDELRTLGFDGFLIGETLMKSGNPTIELHTLVAA